MSEKRSWDVQLRRQSPARTPAAAPAARLRTRPVRLHASGERLHERRTRERKAWRIAIIIALCVLIAVALYVMWLPQLRIQEVTASGPGAQSVEEAALGALAGTYGYVVPRNSVFFFPKSAIRSAILTQHPDIAAVSIKRSSFDSIVLAATPRMAAFVWCGASIILPVNGSCYEADAEGLVFKPRPEELAASIGSTTPPQFVTNELRVYSALASELAEGASPVGMRVSYASAIPDALRFVKAIRELGVPVAALALRDDEADLWVNETTRITYVLGHELDAAQLAASVIPTLDLTDGTIEYLDLRFPGRAYVQRYGEQSTVGQ